MAQRVIMPKQGLQMTEGTITKWLIAEGGICKEGQPLFEMETDKLTITIDSPASGVLLKIVREEGDTVPITETIAIIGERGETFLLDESGRGMGFAVQTQDIDSSAVQRTTTLPQAKQGGRKFITPRAKRSAQAKGLDFNQISGTGPDELIIESDVLNFTPRLKATPLAKKIAEQNGIELASIRGSGERGKVLKADADAAILAKQPVNGEIIPFTGMRKLIAERMTGSLRTAAQASHRVQVDMSEVVRLRESLKAAGKKISFNDIIILSTCRALMQFPILNSELTKDGILLKKEVNMGIAVAIENGLIVPVLHNADKMDLDEISAAAKELGEKAKTGRLKSEDCKEGSFTISNLGMFGLDEFVAILNPPESGILAVGKIEKTPCVVEDLIVIRSVMVLTLTYDHRVVDGAPAAQFLMSIKGFLENPYLLL